MPGKSHLIRAGVARCTFHQLARSKALKSYHGFSFIATVSIHNNIDHDIIMYFRDRKENKESNICIYIYIATSS